jgi:hypothetical protein
VNHIRERSKFDLQEKPIARGEGMEQLQRDLVAELGVVGAVDGSHAAASELLAQAEARANLGP